MTYQIETIDDWPSGDTRVFPFVVKDEDSSDENFDLQGATFTWQLKDTISSEIVLDDSDTGVNIDVTDEAGGEFEVKVEKEVTSDLEGTFREIIKIEDSRGNKTTWNGRVVIEDID
jgi:hypothetical protein